MRCLCMHAQLHACMWNRAVHFCASQPDIWHGDSQSSETAMHVPDKSLLQWPVASSDHAPGRGIYRFELHQSCPRKEVALRPASADEC